MSPWLLWTVSTIYFGVAIAEGIKGNFPMVVIFISYAIANIAFVYAVH